MTDSLHQTDEAPVCALCGRPVPPDVPQSRHHLVPKLKGGKNGETVLLHHICHKEIHASLSEAELAVTMPQHKLCARTPVWQSLSSGFAAARLISPRGFRASAGASAS